jgi:hypothetical protein
MFLTKKVRVIKLREDAQLPTQGSEEAAGFDVYYSPCSSRREHSSNRT